MKECAGQKFALESWLYTMYSFLQFQSLAQSSWLFTFINSERKVSDITKMFKVAAAVILVLLAALQVVLASDPPIVVDIGKHSGQYYPRQ